MSVFSPNKFNMYDAMEYFIICLILWNFIFIYTNIGQVDHLTGCVYVVLLKACRLD